MPTKTKSYDDVTYVLSNTEQRKIELKFPTRDDEDDENDERAPETILWLKISAKGTLLVATSGDCSGYIHEFHLDNKASLLSSVLIEQTADISSKLYVLVSMKLISFLFQQHGVIFQIIFT